MNFVDNMDIIQEFEQLPNGEWVLKTDDMIVEMTLMKIMGIFPGGWVAFLARRACGCPRVRSSSMIYLSRRKGHV